MEDFKDIYDRLRNLNEKLKSRSGYAPKTSSTHFHSSLKSTKDTSSISDIHSRLRRVNEYLKENLTQEEKHAAVSVNHQRIIEKLHSTRQERETITKTETKPVPVVEKQQAVRPASRGTEQVQFSMGVGLDLGTSCLLSARKTKEGKVFTRSERNSFLEVRADQITKDLLTRLKISYVSYGHKMYVLGSSAFDLANIFSRDVRRSMRYGVLNPTEVESLPMLKLLIKNLLWKVQEKGEICCFSIPASPVDKEQDVIYHRGIFEGILRSFEFEPQIIEEGYAVVLSELADRDFTGIGVSCGGGMFNVCVSYKSVPAITFSITHCGDWIDESAGKVLGILASRVTAIKEQGLNLINPVNREQEAISIYYRHMVHYFWEQMNKIIGKREKLPQFKEAIDIVFTGGTALPAGFSDIVKEEFKKIEFVLPVKKIRVAEEPHNSVVRGCLFKAVSSFEKQ